MTVTSEAGVLFEREGFAVLRGVLPLAEVEQLVAICAAHQRSVGSGPAAAYGAADSGLSRDLFLTVPEMPGWLWRNRLHEVAASLLGSSAARPVRDRLFVKAPGTGERTQWHQDRPLTKEATGGLVVLWVLFAGFAEGAAPLQIAAGSHTGGVLLEAGLDSYTSLAGPGTELVTAADVEARFHVVTPAVASGDVLALHGQVLHASLPNISAAERQAYAVRFVPGAAATR